MKISNPVHCQTNNKTERQRQRKYHPNHWKYKQKYVFHYTGRTNTHHGVEIVVEIGVTQSNKQCLVSDN